MRAYELARLRGVTSRELLACLRSHGHDVWSALESLTEQQGDLARSLHPHQIKQQAVSQAWQEHHASFDGWYERDDWDGRLELVPPRQVVFTREAAYLVGVRPATIRQWVARGYLKPIARLGNTHTFRVEDVREAAQDRLAESRSFHSRRETRGARRLPRETKDIDALVPARVAAEVAGVSRSTVRSWIRRGHVRGRGRRDREVLVRLGDVLVRARARGYRPPRSNPMP
ncbi:hypothetical protein [Ornithinimicrobium cryptoxanthini]|uniref:hypothetical protein n=1 Tax=Ornithinimicrobium cryptoxanthini TaxID=2934161 RepID=UPI002118803A|nr:hypothetical protein [Ornithinimicrobium cryptoxanthini]